MTSPSKVHWKKSIGKWKSIESPLENESPLKVHWKKSIESSLEKSIESPLEKVHWKKSIESPMVTWITIFMNNPWHWALNEIRLGEHSYSETTSGEAGGYAQNFIFEQKRKEEKTLKRRKRKRGENAKGEKT